MAGGVRFLQLRASIGDLSSGASRVRAFVVLVATSLLMASSVGSAWANGASVPAAPSINYVAPGDASLEVSFTAPGSDGGAAIEDYKYSTDGTNFLAVGSITSPFTISTLSSDGTTPLTNGTTYSITLKAVNSVGDSQASTAVDGTPGGAPLIPLTGFEDGTTSVWTASSDPLISFNATLTGTGQGAGIYSGEITHSHTSRNARANCEDAVAAAIWKFSPAGNKGGALQPSGSTTFDNATTALGLSNDEKTAITDVIEAQARVNPGCGGSFNPTNAAWTKQTVTLKAGETYKMAWNYIGTDYTPYNDGSITSLVYAAHQAGTPSITVNNQAQNYALLGFTNPGTGDYSAGSYGSTGWQFATYTVSLTGQYVLGFAAFNIGDTSYSPVLVIDDGLGTTLKDGEVFGAVRPNNPDAPVTEAPGIPTIQSITALDGQLEVSFTAPGSDGGAAIEDYKYSTDGTNFLAVGSATSPFTISTLSSDGTTPLTNGTTYSITLKAVNSVGDSQASTAVDGTPVAAVAAPTPRRSEEPQISSPLPTSAPPAAPAPRPATTLSEPSPVFGPVLRNGAPPTPPGAPLALVDGRQTSVQVDVPTSTRLDVSLRGGFNLGFNVLEDQGQITKAPDGTTEIAVRKGGSATLSGSGFRPGATVQVFMPLRGFNSKELARIPVNEDGSFDGSAPFSTRPNEVPLPIGKNVLQLVSLDNDGNQVVVEITVNVAQGAPAPEFNRSEGVIPAMALGQSIATSGGEPVPVTVTAVSDQKLAVVEGDGWTMAINVASETGGVEPSEGGALLKLVRNDTTLVSGSGFMPGTRADVWLFSDPTLLGTVTVDENGEFTGEVNIDANMVPVGEHTLQLQGVGEDGYVKAANMGVLVDDPIEAMPTAVESAGWLLWWVAGAFLLLLLVVMFVIVARRRRSQTR